MHSQPGEGSTFTFDIEYQDCSRRETRPDINLLAMATTDERWIEAMSLLAERWQIGFRAIDPTEPQSAAEFKKLTLADALLTDNNENPDTDALVINVSNGDLTRPVAINEFLSFIDVQVSTKTVFPTETEKPLNNMDVLVAEDNPTNRLVVGKILSSWGANVCFAENGLEATDMYTSPATFDFVLMDCEMPEMDGYTATQKIRSLEQSESRPRVPIIALTAHVLPEFREKAHLSGMSEYITKPINREELLQTILRLTASGQSRLHG